MTRSGPEPRLSRRRLLGLSGTVLGAAGLAGCVDIPTSGPVEAGQGRPVEPNPSVSLAANPPPPDATPLEVVTGFLQAMSYYQVDYAVARDYLTAKARTAWHPESGVQVYADGAAPDVTGSTAQMAATVVGRIATDGAFSGVASPTELEIDFGLTKEAGQWRLATPPDGLLVSLYYFQQFFDSFNLYFFDPGNDVLVPDPIYLPSGNQSATALMARLLKGATEWLRPAVLNAIPAQAQFGVSVPVDDQGVADIAWNDAVSGLDDEQRMRVVAQVVWTLRQVPEVTGVRFTANGTAWSVPRVERADGIVPIGAQDAVSPIARETSLSLVGVGEKGVVRIDDDGRHAAFPAPWGAQGGITSLALDPSATTIAAVIKGTGLATAATGEEVQPVKSLSKVALLRPQFSRFDELWVVENVKSGTPRVWRLVAGKVHAVKAPSLAKSGPVTGFRLSPDGLRMALLQDVGGVTQLSLALLNRSNNDVVISALRPIVLLTSPRMDSLVDVGWSDATTLIVLGSADPGGQPAPQACSQDGSAVRAIGAPDQGSAVGLAVAPRASSTKAALLGKDGQVWRYESDYSWVEIADKITAITFPG